MKPRQKRILYLSLLAIGIGTAATLGLMAFQKNLLFFYSPSQVAAGEAPTDYQFRVGGMVQNGSVQRQGNSLTIQFTLTDYKSSIQVRYTGILPDLFREGQGIVARGKLGNNGIFEAEEVLAKHDENYMPPEVAEVLMNPQE